MNNQIVTLQDLRKVMQELLDIHGQHETQTLLKQKYHLKLLDDYAEDKYLSTKENIKMCLISIKVKQRN